MQEYDLHEKQVFIIVTVASGTSNIQSHEKRSRKVKKKKEKEKE